MNVFDTLIWLLDFPVRHGYVMVFIASFSLAGCFMMLGRSADTAAALRAIRIREGLPSLEPERRSRSFFGRLRRPVFLVLTPVMLASLVLGILGLTGVPVTRAYIYANGVPATATIDGDWVTFTTNTGVQYTLENNFFTPSGYPEADAYIPSDSDVVVRYLPDHPQAYIIDTSQLSQ